VALGPGCLAWLGDDGLCLAVWQAGRLQGLVATSRTTDARLPPCAPPPLQASRDDIVAWHQGGTAIALDAAQRMPTEDWEALQGARGARPAGDDEGRYDSAARAAAALAEGQSWSDKISISQDTQVRVAVCVCVGVCGRVLVCVGVVVGCLGCLVCFWHCGAVVW
jgi:hypothetical protein